MSPHSLYLSGGDLEEVRSSLWGSEAHDRAANAKRAPPGVISIWLALAYFRDPPGSVRAPDYVATPRVTPPTDAAAIQLMIGADPRGFQILYDRYSPLAFALALRILGDRGAAEDVVQEAYLSIWRGIASYQPRTSSARGWICTVVRNRSIDQLRGRNGLARTDVPLERSLLLTTASVTWDQVAAGLARDSVRAALGTLPPEQRQTIELAYYAGLSQTEISRMMGVPLGTVKGRTRIALQKMREAIGDQERP